MPATGQANFVGVFAAANAGDFNHACAEHLVVGFRARRGEDRFGLRSRQRGIAAFKSADMSARTPNLIRFIRSLLAVVGHPRLIPLDSCSFVSIRG